MPPYLASEQILIFRATATIAKPTRFDDFYEFVLGGPDAFPAQVEPSEPVMLKHGAVFPINPGQLHMAVESRPVREYLPIFIAKDFVSELTYQAWGKEQVHFSNRNHPVPESTRCLVREFIEEAAEAGSNQSLRLSSLNYELTHNLIRSVALDPSSKEFCLERQVVRQVEAYLKDSYPDQISLEELAKLVNYSPYHLIRLFKQTTGFTPMAYLLNVRVEQATKLLRETAYTISEICELCGFGSLSHFSNTYKRMTGYSPSEYRRLL